MMRFKWPRGKWNGLRIIGASFKIRATVDRWKWIPKKWSHGGALEWLCFLIWIEWEYESRIFDTPSVRQK